MNSDFPTPQDTPPAAPVESPVAPPIEPSAAPPFEPPVVAPVELPVIPSFNIEPTFSAAPPVDAVPIPEMPAAEAPIIEPPVIEAPITESPATEAPTINSFTDAGAPPTPTTNSADWINSVVPNMPSAPTVPPAPLAPNTPFTPPAPQFSIPPAPAYSPLPAPGAAPPQYYPPGQPYPQAPQGQPYPQAPQGDGTGGLIPYKNPKALTSYYVGLFSLIPVAALVMGPMAIYLGIQGLKFAKENPIVKGQAHAWVGIICGTFWTIVHYGLLLFLIIGAIASIR